MYNYYHAKFHVPRVSIFLLIKQLVADTKTLQWFGLTVSSGSPLAFYAGPLWYQVCYFLLQNWLRTHEQNWQAFPIQWPWHSE